MAVTLSCLMGGAAPPELGDNLASLLDLPEAAQQAYREVLEPNLAPVVDDRAETRVKRFCRRHEIDPGQLAPSVKACRFLVTHAVSAGIDREAFVADLVAVLPEAARERVLERLLPLIDEALPKLVNAAAFLSVAEHGKVVRSVRWRVDEIKASDHSVKINRPVMTITLQYQEGPNAGQASYQLLPEQAAELQRALDAAGITTSR